MSNLLRIAHNEQEAPKDLNLIAASYKSIKKQIEALEGQLKPFKEELEQAAIIAPDNTLLLDEFKVILCEASRETFDIKTAKVKLGEDVIREFLKVSNYTQLRVTESKK